MQVCGDYVDSMMRCAQLPEACADQCLPMRRQFVTTAHLDESVNSCIGECRCAAATWTP